MSSSILFKKIYWGATNNWREKIKGRSKQVNQTQAPSLSHNPPISRTFHYTLWYAEQLVFNQYQKKRTKQKNNFNPRCMLWEYQTLVASLNGSYNGNVRARIPILEMMQQPTGNSECGPMSRQKWTIISGEVIISASICTWVYNIILS